MEDKAFDIQPADRIGTVNEYYFSRKLKEVAQMNANGMDIISLAIGSPDMPPSASTIDTLCREAAKPNTHGYQPQPAFPNCAMPWRVSIKDGMEWNWTLPPRFSPSSAQRKEYCT